MHYTVMPNEVEKSCKRVKLVQTKKTTGELNDLDSDFTRESSEWGLNTLPRR